MKIIKIANENVPMGFREWLEMGRKQGYVERLWTKKYENRPKNQQSFKDKILEDMRLHPERAVDISSDY